MRFTQFAHNVAKMFFKNNDSLLVNSVRTIFFCHHIILTYSAMLTFDKKILLKLIVYLSINTYICTYNYAYHYLLSLLESIVFV